MGSKAATTTSTTAMLAKGAMKAMLIAQVKTAALVTAVAIAVGGAGVTTVVAVAKEQAKTEAKANPPAVTATAGPAAESARPALGSALRIRMTDSEGTPASNASVEVAFDLPRPLWLRQAFWTFAWTNTDANGSCELSAPSNAIAAYLAFVEPSATSGLWVTNVTGSVEPVFAGGRTRLRIKPAANGAVDLRVQTAPLPSRLVGRVTDPEKKPVASARVEFSATPGLPTRRSSPPYFAPSDAHNRSCVTVTDPNGSYSIALLDGAFGVQSVSCPGQPLLYWNETLELRANKRLRRGVKMEHNIELSLGGAMEATMLDPENKPLKGVMPHLIMRFLPTSLMVRPQAADAASDENGKTLLGNIPPGMVSLSVTRPNDSSLVPITPNIVTTVESGKVSQLAIRFVRGATLRGRITTEGGAPVAGYRLRENAVSDTNGNYVIEGLPSGAVYLAPDLKNYPTMAFTVTSRVEVCAGGDFSRDIVLKTLKPVELTGRILDPQGNLVPRVTVLANPRYPNRAVKPVSGVSGDDGRYRIAGLLEGGVDVGLDIPDLPLGLSEPGTLRQLATETDMITLSANPVTVRDFQLMSATVVKLNLRDEQGNPVSVYPLQCHDYVTNANSRSSISVQFKPTATPGTFAAKLGKRDMKAGDTRFLALEPEPGTLLPDLAEIPLGTDVGKVIERDVVLRKGAAIKGQLLDSDGKPVAEARITCWNAQEYDRMKSFGVIRPPSDLFRTGSDPIITDPEGRFRIENVPVGDYGVGAEEIPEESLQIHTPARVAVESARDVDLKLVCEAIGAVDVRVCTSDDERISAGVRLVSTTGTEMERSSSLQPPSIEDPFRRSFATARPGTYELLISSPFAVNDQGGLRSARELDAAVKQLPKTQVDVVAGKTTNVTMRLALTSQELRTMLQAGDRGYKYNPVDSEKIRNRILADWSKVRLTEQALRAQVTGSRLSYTNTLQFVTGEAVTNALLGLVMSPEAEKIAVSLSDRPISEIERAPVPKARDMSKWPDLSAPQARRPEDPKDTRLRDRDWAIASSLYAFTGPGLRDNNWRAWNLDLAPARTNTALVEAVLMPFPFANSAKGEPCIAYRIPIRQGCCWARPAGKLAVTITLGDDVKSEDVVFVRPTEVKRDGRTLTYTLDGADPDEDLLLVLKGRLP